MNSFDTARETARGLRRELYASGLVSDRPLEVALAAAARLKLGVVWLQPSDPALHGALAVWDPQASIVKCSNAGGQGDRALRLAHELAHEKVHRRLPPGVPGTFGSRSDEALDYGPRERREKEAEVFARELLLPADELRLHYLQPEVTAAGIAKSLGLPAGLVERQLLDAMLLPASPTLRRMQRPPAKPDASQVTAATHVRGPLLLQAGPGTGKTSTLVSRVLHLVERNIDPAAILVLTFSRRAASEAAERICAALPEAGSRIWVGTFHQFGMDVIARHYELLGLPPKPSLLDASAAVELLEDILPTLGLVHHRLLWEPALVLKDILRAISKAKDELAGPERYAELAERMRVAATDDEGRLEAAKATEVAKVYACYRDRMRSIGGVDYGDQVMIPALLCEDRPDVVASLRSRHSHVLVDEYQDVNSASISLLKSLAGPGGDIWAVGDPRQAVYRFRGASASGMAKFGEDFGPFVPAQLEVNYRSTGEVVDTFLEFASDMQAAKDMPRMRLSASRGHLGLRPELAVLDTDAAEIDAVVEGVRELATKDMGYSGQAVLCRTNARVDAVAAALEDAGIPVLHLGNIFERSEIRDLLSLLSLAVDATGTGLPRVAALRRYGMSLSDVHLVAAGLRQDRGQSAIEVLRGMEPPRGLSDNGRSGFLLLRSDLHALDVWSTPWEFLTSYVIDRTDCLRELASGNSVAERTRCLAVWRFMEFVREQPPGPGGPPIRRLLDRIRRIVLLGEARAHGSLPDVALNLEAVKVMTVHGSKGLEFEAVHLPGMNAGQFPKDPERETCPPPPGLVVGTGDDVRPGAADEKEAEEECLFFVAVSRARTHLRIYRSHLSKVVRGKARETSPFLLKVASYVDGRDLHPAPQMSASAAAAFDIRWPDGAPALEGHHLALYAKCPRRLFHTLVLGIRGARKTGPFASTHDCVQELVTRLKSDRDENSAALEDLHAEFASIWRRGGPHDHAYAGEYLRLGSSLVTALHKFLHGRAGLRPVRLEVRTASGVVRVQADDLVPSADGLTVLRRIRTGFDPGPTSSENDILHVLLHLAVAAGGEYRVESAYLTGGQVRPVPLTARKLENRRRTVEQLMAALERGEFPAMPNSRDCPKCPHWFACGSLPHGSLSMAPTLT